MVLVAGCGTYVTATPLNNASWEGAPRPSSRVEVFASGPPQRPYRDVALLEAEQTHGLNEQGTPLMLERLREQAREIGCDAIVLGGFTERDGAQPGTGWHLLDPGATTLRATCIVYREARPVRAAAAPPVTAADGTQRTDGEDPR